MAGDKQGLKYILELDRCHHATLNQASCIAKAPESDMLFTPAEDLLLVDWIHSFGREQRERLAEEVCRLRISNASLLSPGLLTIKGL